MSAEEAQRVGWRLFQGGCAPSQSLWVICMVAKQPGNTHIQTHVGSATSPHCYGCVGHCQKHFTHTHMICHPILCPAKPSNARGYLNPVAATNTPSTPMLPQNLALTGSSIEEKVTDRGRTPWASQTARQNTKDPLCRPFDLPTCHVMYLGIGVQPAKKSYYWFANI